MNSNMSSQNQSKTPGVSAGSSALDNSIRGPGLYHGMPISSKFDKVDDINANIQKFEAQ